jgi:hypothetical protein
MHHEALLVAKMGHYDLVATSALGSCSQISQASIGNILCITKLMLSVNNHAKPDVMGHAWHRLLMYPAVGSAPFSRLSLELCEVAENDRNQIAKTDGLPPRGERTTPSGRHGMRRLRFQPLLA